MGVSENETPLSKFSKDSISLIFVLAGIREEGSIIPVIVTYAFMAY